MSAVGNKKACTLCGVVQGLDDFHRAKRGVGGRTSHCKSCRAEEAADRFEANKATAIPAQRAYRQANAAQLRARELERREVKRPARVEAQRQRRVRERSKFLARKAVANAVRRGELVRPDRCARCGEQAFVQGHHESYEESRWLDVEWICSRCHQRHHAGDQKVAS